MHDATVGEEDKDITATILFKTATTVNKVPFAWNAVKENPKRKYRKTNHFKNKDAVCIFLARVLVIPPSGCVCAKAPVQEKCVYQGAQERKGNTQKRTEALSDLIPLHQHDGKKTRLQRTWRGWADHHPTSTRGFFPSSVAAAPEWKHTALHGPTTCQPVTHQNRKRTAGVFATLRIAEPPPRQGPQIKVPRCG